MLHTEVTVPAEKMRKPCHCGHARAVHYKVLGDGLVLERQGPCHALRQPGPTVCSCT